jgi:hypothetical protein
MNRPRFDDPRRWFVLTLSSLLAGCLASPASSVGRHAVDAATKGRLDAFRSQLSPAAQSTLGTTEAIEALRQKLAGYANVRVGDARLTSAPGNQADARSGEILRTYEAPVSGSASNGAPAELIFTLQLRCAVSYDENRHGEAPDSCSTMIERTDVPWTNCTPGAPAGDSTGLRESCALTGIRTQSQK